ncbi:MAG: alpha-galactosidase [Verrucomicrobia bacterium]|nr:alpha-galactosidase [Verrucomicrobiota bacterium]
MNPNANPTADELLTTHRWVSAAVLRQATALDGTSMAVSGAKFSTAIPFSFVYGGKPSAQLLPSWKYSIRKEAGMPGTEKYVITYLDPATGLQIACEAVVYNDYPAVEWLLRLTNTGTVDTPIIENILPLDMGITTPDKGAAPFPGLVDVMLHHVYDSGRTCTDYLPQEKLVYPGADITLSPHIKSVDLEAMQSREERMPVWARKPGSIPYFSLEWSGGGVVGGIGWTGMWRFDLRRDQGRELTMQVGQDLTHLKLHPGESIRSPSVLLVPWQGNDRMRGHNFLRRLLLAHYVPKVDGQIPVVPISHCCWFYLDSGNNGTEEIMFDVIDKLSSFGVEAFWLDAGWFEGGWPNGAGNWMPRPEQYPRGLKPIADAAKKHGMKFILWFESERVVRDTKIQREHPQWVIGERLHREFALEESGYIEGEVFNQGDPAARQWMTDFLSDCIAEWGVDIYRQDRNFVPLSCVNAYEKDDRQGMAEIRYVEGHYAMYDELLRRHPGLMIDNANWRNTGCDLEMVKRTIGSLTRSEWTIFPSESNQSYDQMGTAALSQYVPLSASLIHGFDPYRVRSGATSGVGFCLDPRDKMFPVEQARRAVEEIRSLRPYWSGDFYPLVERIDSDDRNWCAWQFHRPDLDAGFAVFFRRSKCPFVLVEIALRAIDPHANYKVAFKETYDVKEERTMSGADLAKLRVEILDAPGSVLVTYENPTHLAAAPL